MRVGQFHQVLPILRLAHLLPEAVQPVEVYPALAPGYLLDAADAEALAVLYRRHEVGGLESSTRSVPSSR